MECCFPDISWQTIEAWWDQLKKSNKTSIELRTKLKMPFFATSEKMVKLICNIGNHMQLPRDVLLSSILLFDLFMIYSFKEMNEIASTKKKNLFGNKLKCEVILSIVSCLQLSSKALGHLVPISEIQQFVRKCYRAISKIEILKSEQRVFKTVMFKIPVFSPLIYVETLVHLLPKNKVKVECSLFMKICGQYLIIAFCHHHAIYDSLFYIMTSKKNCFYKDRMLFVHVELDMVFAAGAAVTAAAQALGVWEPWLESRLSLLTEVPSRELRRLAMLLHDAASSSASSKVSV